ncbi:MAG: hypothetical protein ACI85Q_000798 [Salibacteraceae bacterium]|jgi:hypothetical protein
MCTFTFYPLKNSFILTSNRDEHVNRGVSLFPVFKKIDHQTITYPQDPAAGGTWLATSTQNRTMVLLNGAFEKHTHSPPYRLSRGIVLLDAFKWSDLTQFSKSYDLTQIEPFTLVNVNIEGEVLEELRWDGDETHVKSFSFQKPHIWSSSTLYTAKVVMQRKAWFTKWINKPHVTSKEMLAFHHFGGGDKLGGNTITMARGTELRTVSISQIHHTSGKTKFTHHNLLNAEQSSVII